MADTGQSLFFADSDDEDFVGIAGTLNVQQKTSLSPPSEPGVIGGPPKESGLFYPDSDEDEPMEIPSTILIGNTTSRLQEDIEDADVEIPQLEHHRASSVSVASSAEYVPRDSSPVSLVDVERASEPPKKKRKLSPVTDDFPFGSAYLGSFLVGNAWSTVNGKGYVKVRLHR